ncbi:MAG: hypothetical protein K0S36_1630 [Nitrosospira multiformis]|jgi:hypothetical protein|nr:hypothetical protein [Nitrosospira multiformis]
MDGHTADFQNLLVICLLSFVCRGRIGGAEVVGIG